MTPGDDYRLLSNKLTFSSQSAQNASVLITLDRVREEIEEFRVQLHLPENSTGLGLQHDTALVQIIDEDRKSLHCPHSVYKVTGTSLLTLGVRMHSKGCGSRSVYLSVCLSVYDNSRTTGYEAAYKRYQHLQYYKSMKNKIMCRFC